MSSYKIVLIDIDRIREHPLATVLRFIECDFRCIPPDDIDELLKEEVYYDAIFVTPSARTAVTGKLDEMLALCPVVLFTEQGSVTTELPTGVSSMEWPIGYQALTDNLKRILRDDPGGPGRAPHLFRSLSGQSAAIQQVRRLIQQVASSEATVLVLGESGTGKEVVARNLHYFSARRNKTFVPVNCGAIPAELLESELFGHEKGAFTGALQARQGRFELAEGGTLFLDEIGDMPLSMQVKLLRVLQERTFERVGSNKTIVCDVRVIAATHRNLEEEIRQNRFREDLFYRLNVFPIELPALRFRSEDIPLLIEDLVNRLKGEKRGVLQFTHSAMQLLKRHHWPGNVRELANLIERLAILYPNKKVEAADLPEKFQQYRDADFVEEPESEMATEVPLYAERREGCEGFGAIRLPPEGLDLREHLNNLECELIKQALDECHGVVAHAANLLRMRRTTLVEKLRKYGLQRGDEVTLV